MEPQKTQNCQSSLEGQTPSRRHNSPRLQAILESHSHQTVWYWYQNKQTEQSYRVENPERNPNTYSQLIFDKGGKNIKWKRVFSANCSWETWTAAWKSMKLELTLTPCTQINSKWLKDQYTTRHHPTPGREHRQKILWHQSYKSVLRSVSPSNRKKSKNKSMGPHQMDKILHSKGNQNKNKKTACRMGEKSFKWCNWQGPDL